ncbi:3-oxoacyl-[acyl-carrier-protein] synthase III C-terminal domain-containing protein [Streptomyces spiramenti]|uniref:3-oxoacyl-ACP synthase n=1 Tax=Streptomyces spiramenti TaxID=2720606 RepID=A0ABX1AUG9_9ACTN|nr:3-oxoacyl-[acyl-carrier-protein] synthase III C-terminal domain-containing protein [Streptomyces spiramenti]NJP68448.1 3-oxoacyl-ACP synthase [Streptomyces spiramenti]
MTALVDVASHFPGPRLPIEEVGNEADMPHIRIFRRYFGLDTVHRAPGVETHRLHAAAADSLSMLRGREHLVRYVVMARSIATGASSTEEPPEELCRLLGLPDAVAFTVTQHACAAGLLAVHLVGEMLAADGDPDALGLVLAGERVATRHLQIVPRSTVLGEGTAAVLVGTGGDRDRMLSYVTHTRGRFADGIPPHPVEKDFFREHQIVLAETLREAVAAAGTTLEQLRLVLPHNVNTMVWRKLCEDHGFDERQLFLENVPFSGHCFGADSFLNHVTARERGLLAPGDLYLMVGVGLGATYSAAVFRH